MGERGRWLAAWGLLAAVPVAAWFASRVVVDNRLERWMDRDGEPAARHEAFRKTFGSDELLLVAVGGRPLFEPASLDLMLEGFEALEAIPGVVRAQGIPALFRDRFGGEDPKELRDELTSTPFYRDLLISRDGEVAGFVLEVEPGDDPAARRRLVAEVERAVAPLREGGFRVGLVGSTVLIAALDGLSESEARRSFPLAVLGSLALLAWLLRSVRAMAAAAVSAGVSVALALGLVAGLGGTLSMLTAALPALVWVLAISFSVHVLHRAMRRRHLSPPAEAVAVGTAESARGITFSAITTALGFASLVVAPLQPVRELGMYGAAGILIACLVSLTVTPLLARFAALPPSRRARDGQPPARRPWPIRNAGAVLFTAGCLAALALGSVPAIRLESNPLTFLPSGHPLARDYAWVAQELTGSYTAEIVLRTPEPWTEPAVWPILDQLGAKIAASPAVARVVSPLDLLRKLNQWDHGVDPVAYQLPQHREDAQRLLRQLDPIGRQALASLAAENEHEVRLSVVVRDMDERRFLALASEVRAHLDSLPPGYSGFVTGQVLRLVTAQKTLVATQLRSLALALVVIFAAVGIGLGSWPLTLAAVPANLVPVAVAFGAMAWLGIPLDAGTVMVASVALGIAVDSTIHFLLAYRAAATAPAEAAAIALVRVGPAIRDATLAATIGFLALATSAFMPIRYFGVLSALIMGVALACHLLVTPALLASSSRIRITGAETERR